MQQDVSLATLSQRLELELFGVFNTQFYNPNGGDNLEASIPTFSKGTVWLALAVPLLGFTVYWLLRKVIHILLVNLIFKIISSLRTLWYRKWKLGKSSKLFVSPNILGDNQYPLSDIAATPATMGRGEGEEGYRYLLHKDKKRFIDFILFTDILCCALCFGLYGVPLGDFTYLDSRLMQEPDYSQLTRFYWWTDVTPQSPLSGEDILFWNQTELRSSCYDQTTNGFYRGVNKTLLDWKIHLLLSSNGSSSSSVDNVALNIAMENLIHDSTILELVQIYQISSHWAQQQQQGHDPFADILGFTENEQLKVSNSLAQMSPLGLSIKSIENVGALQDQQKQPHLNKVCCVCYTTPVIYGWLTELLLVYGLLLLLGVLVVGKRTSIYTLCFYTVLSLILPCLSHAYVMGLHYRDVYNLLVPSRTLSQVLQSCITVYSSIQTHYPAYYLIISHAAFKLGCIYTFMLVVSVKKKFLKEKIDAEKKRI